MLTIRQSKISFVATSFLAIILVASCKKDSSSIIQNPRDTDNCITGRTASDGQIITQQYIIAYNSSVTNNTRVVSEEGVQDLSVKTLADHFINRSAFQKSFTGKPSGFVARLTTDELASLKNDPNIGIIEPDRVVALGTCFTVVDPTLVTWGAKRVGYGDGTGKTCWVVDTGIEFDHPDLNVDVNRSKSFISSSTSADDQNGHGTHVAGIIGAKNNSIGMLGIASGATLVSLRVLDANGKGNASSIIQALAYINSNAKAGDVVNMSFGLDTLSQVLDQQVQNTAAKGIYFAIAAGNDKKPAINFSPGRANGSNIFTVSAIDSLDNFASFSNYGNDAVDVAAPGVYILSTYLNGRYAIMSGTSMAAPYVAGLLLLKGKNITYSGTANNDPDGTPDPIAHY